MVAGEKGDRRQQSYVTGDRSNNRYMVAGEKGDRRETIMATGDRREHSSREKPIEKQQR